MKREKEHTSLHARCAGGYLDGLTVNLSLSSYSVDLSLYGASRAARNSVLPDIKTRIERLARDSDAFPWLRVLRTATYSSFVALAAGLVVLVALLAGSQGIIIALPAVLLCSLPALWLRFHIDERLDDARPAVEFLPDSGKSRWSDMLAKLTTAGKRTSALITIVGVVVGILAAFGVF